MSLKEREKKVRFDPFDMPTINDIICTVKLSTALSVRTLDLDILSLRVHLEDTSSASFGESGIETVRSLSQAGNNYQLRIVNCEIAAAAGSVGGLMGLCYN